MEAKDNFEADPSKVGQKFDENKFIVEYRKPATDSRTEKQNEIFRKTQQEAIEKQTQLLNGQLSAGEKMLEAGGILGTAGKALQEAAEKLKEWASSLWERIGGDKLFAKVWDSFVDALKPLEVVIQPLVDTISWLTEGAIKGLAWNLELMTKGLDIVVKLLTGDFVGASNAVVAAFKFQIDGIVGAFTFLKDGLFGAGNALAKYSEKFAKGIEAAWTALGGILKMLPSWLAPEAAAEPDPSPDRFPAGRMPVVGNILRDPARRRDSGNTTEAPFLAEGGIIPGTKGGTTVAVGEKGKPEAIVPLEQLKGMIGGSTSGNKDSDAIITQLISTNKDSDATITRLNVINNNLNQTNNKLLEANNKIIEAAPKQFKLTDDNNKLLGTDGPLIKSTNALKTTDDKLIVSMKNVTDMLPNVLAQIISAIASGSGAGNTAGGGIFGSAPAGGGSAPAPQSSTSGGTPAGGMVKAGTDMLKKMGLIFSPGRDLQKENGDIDPKLIEIAKQVQATIPGFQEFTGFNDAYHTKETPNSQHTKGKAFDFALNRTPSKEEGEKIKSQLKALGLDLVKDEYNDTSGAFRTGGHFHGQLNAYDGGVFEPRPGGVHVNLAEAGLREAAVPLNPGEKIRVEKSEQENNPPRKDPLSTVLATDAPSNSNQAAEILAGIHDLMEDKFDSMISAIRDGNNISDKILKYSQA
jgi:hypothetical protein